MLNFFFRKNTLDELLLEVSDGNYENFRAWLVKTNCTKLDLINKLKPNFKLSRLLQALENTHVTTLDLSFNHISDNGAKDIASNLSKTNIQTLLLRGNYIGDIGAEAIAAILPNTKITEIVLANNNISDLGAKAIVLDELLLEVSKGNYENFRAWLVETNCTSLNLKGKVRDFNLSHLIKALKNTPVTMLDLSSNAINENDANAIAPHLCKTNLEVLQLKSNFLKDMGCNIIACHLPNTKIRMLGLCDNMIGDLGAECIAKTLPRTKITTLNLSNNNISDFGAQDLAAVLPNTDVTNLNLGQNKIGDSGARAITTILPEKEIIVNVMFNPIKDQKILSSITQSKIMLSTSSVAYLRQKFMDMAENEKVQYLSELSKLPLPSSIPKQRAMEIKKAATIMMELPEELWVHVLSFLRLSRSNWRPDPKAVLESHAKIYPLLKDDKIALGYYQSLREAGFNRFLASFIKLDKNLIRIYFKEDLCQKAPNQQFTEGEALIQKFIAERAAKRAKKQTFRKETSTTKGVFTRCFLAKPQ